MTHYSFLQGLGISTRGKKPLFNFILFLPTGRYTMSNFAGGISWGMEKEGEPWKSRKGVYFCSNLTPAKKMTVIKRTTNDNIYPAHSNRSPTASNHTGQ